MQPSERLHSHQEFHGSIESVRAVEDCIRQTGKYTKGLLIEPALAGIQGAGFPSKVVRELYEVYPTLESGLGLGMNFALFVGVLTTIAPDPVQVLFRYDYRTGIASVLIKEAEQGIEKLTKGIPGFADAMGRVQGDTETGQIAVQRLSVAAAATPQIRQATTW